MIRRPLHLLVTRRVHGYITINGVKSHYRDPFTLTESANITAWAEKMGKADSDIVTAAFIKIVDGVAVGTFNFPDKNFRDVVKNV